MEVVAFVPSELKVKLYFQDVKKREKKMMARNSIGEVLFLESSRGPIEKTS